MTDWKPYEKNPFIEYSDEKNNYKCTECNREFASKVNAARHSNSIHKMTLEGEQKNPSTKEKKKLIPLTETIENTEEKSMDDQRDYSYQKIGKTPEELREFLGTNQVRETGIANPADLALEINAKEEAKHVSELVRNPYVLYLFTKMREERIIYPDWTLADVLREGFLVLADKLGCYAIFGQDLERVKLDPQWASVTIKVAEAWRDYDVEQELENTKDAISA